MALIVLLVALMTFIFFGCEPISYVRVKNIQTGVVEERYFSTKIDKGDTVYLHPQQTVRQPYVVVHKAMD